MSNKAKTVILLSISGIFLIVASVLVTYTVMNYVNFKAKVAEQGGNVDKVVEEEKKRPLSNEEIEEFKTKFNEELLGNFLSSISFLSLDDVNISNSNLIKYVYPKFEGANKDETGAYTLAKDDFRNAFFNLTGKNLSDQDIVNSALWNLEDDMIKFTPDEKTMQSNIKIDSSYKIEDVYYLDISIDNNIYGSMKRSISLNKLDDSHYKFIFLKSAN